jgi:hypothetical protein
MDQVNAAVGNKIDALKWVDPFAANAPLAFDHSELLNKAITRLRTKVERHALPLHMLPQKFTLSQLQRTCEIVLGRDLDKSVFRRRLKDLHGQELVEVTGKWSGITTPRAAGVLQTVSVHWVRENCFNCPVYPTDQPAINLPIMSMVITLFIPLLHKTAG